MVGRTRQGWAIFASMMVLWVVLIAVIYPAEQHGTPAEHQAGSPTAAISGSTGGNMEGKEVRNGIAQSALWATTTTVTSNGSVDSAHESVHRPRRRRADVGPRYERGGLRRRRHRHVLDAPVRDHRRLHRRADGRTNARVPGQEDPGARDQARLARRALHPAGGPRHDGRGDRRPATGSRPSTPSPGRRGSRRRSTRTSRRRTTTGPPSPATPGSCSRTPRATSVPTGSPSPTSSAA